MTEDLSGNQVPGGSGVATADPIRGRAAGVPFVALPPAGDAADPAPVVVAWHLLDPPRTEAAFAAALPLDGLPAWRVYLGLPLTGARLPAGGFEDLARRGFEEPVLRLQAPVVLGAAAEFAAAFAELRERLGFDAGRVGFLGGSAGAAVAQLVATERGVRPRATVLVSPVVQLARAVDAMTAEFGMTYAWPDAARAVAARLDFVARARELAVRAGAIRLVVGELDGAATREPAAQLAAALTRHGAAAGDLATVAGMAHALSEEPGTDPSPPTPHAVAVDGLAREWFERHLTAGIRP